MRYNTFSCFVCIRHATPPASGARTCRLQLLRTWATVQDEKWGTIFSSSPAWPECTYSIAYLTRVTDDVGGYSINTICTIIERWLVTPLTQTDISSYTRWWYGLFGRQNYNHEFYLSQRQSSTNILCAKAFGYLTNSSSMWRFARWICIICKKAAVELYPGFDSLLCVNGCNLS